MKSANFMNMFWLSLECIMLRDEMLLLPHHYPSRDNTLYSVDNLATTSPNELIWKFSIFYSLFLVLLLFEFRCVTVYCALTYVCALSNKICGIFSGGIGH